MRTYLGVDGGGSKTDFVLIDESGRTLASQREGPAYYLETGIDALRSMIVQGIRATLAQAGFACADLTFAFVGLPAYGEDSALTPRLDQIASSALPGRYRCGNDMVCGWAGALAGRDGINIVAGTGSIAYGEFQTRSARAGGWGELIGDEGSAFWIAREALALFARMSDGRAARGPLYDLMRGHFRVAADLDVCGAVYGPPALTRSELAALAPIAARAARAGDAATRRLFGVAADELAASVHAVRDRLAVPAEIALPVSYSGGMFRLEQQPLTPLLEAALSGSGRSYRFAAPRLNPGAGAALYAAKLAGAPLADDAVVRLAKSHAAVADDPAG